MIAGSSDDDNSDPRWGPAHQQLPGRLQIGLDFPTLLLLEGHLEDNAVRGTNHGI